MKIARIIPYFSSGFGGPVTYLKNLLKNLQTIDIENYIFTTNIEKKKTFFKRDKKLVSNKIFIYKYTPLLKKRHFFLTPQMIIGLIKNKFDIIELNCVRNFQVDLALFLFSLIRKGTPIILNTHGTMSTPDLSKFKNLFKKIYFILFEKYLLNRVNYFIVSSRTEKNSLIKQKILSEKILIIPQGIDKPLNMNNIIPGKFRKKYGINNDIIIISCIGRIFRGKGIQYLLKAVPILKKNIKKFKIIIAGKDDGYLNNLRTKVENLKIEEDVIFTGFLPKKYNKLWELYKDTDILVAPSISESFGYVLIEGITFKIPIIYSSKNNLLLESDKSGIYVPFGNYKLLARNIINLIKNKDYRNTLVSNALNIIQNLPSWETIVRKHYKLYQFLKEKRYKKN